jgi:hypothetical protein
MNKKVIWYGIRKPLTQAKIDTIIPEPRRRRSILGRIIDWLDSPAGPWSTVLLIGFILSLAAIYYWFWPTMILLSTAIEG